MIDVTPFVLTVSKRPIVAVLKLNYEAMIYSLIIRVLERMPAISYSQTDV
ncbi:hypothetical protein QNH20_05270 [Neobacillus sp. WH10]|nr:hypothetical protein [Neobacillus sp. WH10]WHY78556.1 hypothetical protein QNH20_05270 [Neobacillus sp. WH10]